MASRTSGGARILQTLNTRSIRHNGDRLPVGRSTDDTVIERILNTSFRPPEGDATRD